MPASATHPGPNSRHLQQTLRRLAASALLALSCSGCAVVAVADAAITVVATTVSVGATVVGTAVDVTAAGVKAVVRSDEEKE